MKKLPLDAVDLKVNVPEVNRAVDVMGFMGAKATIDSGKGAQVSSTHQPGLNNYTRTRGLKFLTKTLTNYLLWKFRVKSGIFFILQKFRFPLLTKRFQKSIYSSA